MVKYNPMDIDYGMKKEDLIKQYRDLVNLEKKATGAIYLSLVKRKRAELGAYLEKE